MALFILKPKDIVKAIHTIMRLSSCIDSPGRFHGPVWKGLHELIYICILVKGYWGLGHPSPMATLKYCLWILSLKGVIFYQLLAHFLEYNFYICVLIRGLIGCSTPGTPLFTTFVHYKRNIRCKDPAISHQNGSFLEGNSPLLCKICAQLTVLR